MLCRAYRMCGSVTCIPHCRSAPENEHAVSGQHQRCVEGAAVGSSSHADTHARGTLSACATARADDLAATAAATRFNLSAPWRTMKLATTTLTLTLALRHLEPSLFTTLGTDTSSSKDRQALPP